MATFEVSVKISSEDVTGLKAQGYSLYVFKSIEASGSGVPTVWFNLNKDKLSTNTKITWEDNKFKAYNSTTHIKERIEISPGNTMQTDLGNLIKIEKDSGILSETIDGIPGAISYLNLDTQQYTVGIIQLVEESYNILCAFNIPGAGAAKVITPISKIALIFSTAQIEAGVVIKKAMSNGALIDFTGATSRTVDFSLNLGWTANSATWLTTFIAFTDLTSLLIESPNKAERELEMSHAKNK